MLSPAQLQARDGKITASFLPALMAGDEKRILNEWRRVVGDPAWESENLDDSWPVQLGTYLEPFALDWHERKTGNDLTRRGEVVVHPGREYVCCTLDAYRQSDASVIDCKVIGQWRKLDDAIAHYVPQMVIQRACVEAHNAALLIVHGGAEPEEHPVTWDGDYERLVWQRVDEFWTSVETLTPPSAMPAVAAPVKAEKVYDLTGNNEWASEAVTWLNTRQAAKDFTAAEKAIKKLVPADAAKAAGHGITVSRNKAGSLSIKELS